MWIVFAKPTIPIAGIIAAIPCVMLMKKGTMRKRKNFEGRKERRKIGWKEVKSEGVRVTEEGGREDRGREGQVRRDGRRQEGRIEEERGKEGGRRKKRSGEGGKRRERRRVNCQKDADQ